MAVNLRAMAARCLFAVIDKGRSLGDELPAYQDKVAVKDKALLQEVCYGVLRYLPSLEYQLQQLMDKPLKGKQRVAHFLILVGIYQIKHTRIPDHAAVGETVAGCKPLKHDYLKGLINGVLRNYQRNINSTPSDQSNLPNAIHYNHPSWFINKLKLAYPNNWQQILTANLQRPPMWLRVNARQYSVTEYLHLLEKSGIEYQELDQSSGAIKLTKAVEVDKLPGFNQGSVSIQDAAAQQAARLLDCQTGDIVLDCCAAPGGKTCHILEHSPKIASMTAVDVDATRLLRVKENLQRLNLTATVITGDAANTDAWWNGVQFDRILLDAPCSGTGVIRRHPDIKWLRKAEDISTLTTLQYQIFKKCWSLLKPGGTLLYATCSILPEENYQQVQRFVDENIDAEHIPINNEDALIGWQIVPNEQSMDGFYYAKLIKKAQT